MKILMETKNPGKLAGAKQAFEKYFDVVEIQGLPVDSEVGNQPVNETVLLGAQNRVKNLKLYAENNHICADFFIANESGIVNLLDKWININLAVIENKDGLQSVGTSQGFHIPDKYVEEIKHTELGVLMDNIFEKNNLAKGKGGISFLTHGMVSRIDMTRNAFLMALTTYLNGHLWR